MFFFLLPPVVLIFCNLQLLLFLLNIYIFISLILPTEKTEKFLFSLVPVFLSVQRLFTAGNAFNFPYIEILD